MLIEKQQEYMPWLNWLNINLHLISQLSNSLNQKLNNNYLFNNLFQFHIPPELLQNLCQLYLILVDKINKLIILTLPMNLIENNNDPKIARSLNQKENPEQNLIHSPIINPNNLPDIHIRHKTGIYSIRISPKICDKNEHLISKSFDDKQQNRTKKWKFNALYSDQYVQQINKSQLDLNCISKLQTINHLQIKKYSNQSSLPQIRKQIFFTRIGSPRQRKNIYICSKQQITNAINSSSEFIKLIKLRNKKNYIKIKKANKYKTYTKVNNQISISTGQNINSISNDSSTFIFTYLNRDKLNKKLITVDQRQVNKFFSCPKMKNEHILIEYQTRKFLLDKMRNDYKNYHEVDQFKKQIAKKIIKAQLQEKKQFFKKDYHNRHNCPYFSFLSLPKMQKQLVIQSQKRESTQLLNFL